MVDFLRIIVVVFVIAATVAVVVWEKIVAWMQNSLFPWVEQNLPVKVVELVKQAFAAIDQVAVRIRNAVKQAWETLRRLLLKVVIQWEKQTSTKWVKRWTGWMIIRLKSGEIAPVKRTEEEVLNWSELPPDVRESSLRFDKNSYELDFTEIRDREIAELLS